MIGPSDWDYFEFYPLSQPVRGRWARLFIERSDGGWNFHPRGFGEPGYRVDQRSRDVLTRASFSARTPFEWLFLAGPAVSIAAHEPFKFLRDDTFSYALIALYLASVAYFVVKGRTTRRDAVDLLARSPQIVKPLSAIERLHRNIEGWRATPRMAKVCTFLLVFFFCQGCLMTSIKLMRAADFVSHIDAIINAALFVGSAHYLIRLILLARAAKLAPVTGPATVAS